MNTFKNKVIQTLSEAIKNGADVIVKNSNESKSGNTVILFKYDNADRYSTFEIEDVTLATEILTELNLIKVEEVETVTTETFLNAKKETVEAVELKDLYEKFNCTTKNKRVIELLNNGAKVHHWDDNFYYVIGTKKSMIKISKKKDVCLMTMF